MNAAASQPPTRLARRLGTGDAVVIGLGSMIGAGVFAALGPAADVAGAGLLVGLAVAAVVAYCNAASSAQLAARYPSSGGTYVYGRERLGHLWGFLAGWGFVIGKTASCAAIALTFAAYAAPDATRPVAIGAVVALTAVNLTGIQKTARLTALIVAIVLTALAVVVTAGLTAGPSTSKLGALTAGGIHGIVQAAGLLFFAFAGYARIATLGEEVKDPRRTIPRAIPLALGIVLVVYAAVATVALLAVGPDTLAASAAPLTSVVRAGSFTWAGPVVRIGAAVASLGVLLSLLAGLSRTTFAMASERDLPHWLSAVHPRRRVPHRAELSIAAIVVTVLLFADIRGAIGFSSFAVLVYYAIANASAWTLPREHRRWPRAISVVGFVGCVVVAVALPGESIVGGLLLLALGLVAWFVRRRSALRRPVAGATPPPMAVKITISFSDPEDPDAFVSHYLDTHVPLVNDLPGLRAFEYGRALTNFDGSAPDAFWVISMTFDSEEAMHAAFASEAGQKTIADMPNYQAGSRVSVVSEVQ